jgi:MoxR-like ATPase
VDGSAPSVAELDRLQELVVRVTANVGQVLRGKNDLVELAVSCLLAEGHLLIEDVPGVGKTVLAKALAASWDAEHSRIQCTPDLLPADITGTSMYHQGTGRFEFRPGPVFAGVVLVDEINRASPKTQSALLEVMAERRVSVDGRPRPVPRPFLVIATQNPIEYAGTYPLPEAQLDRFMIKTSIGYPPHAEEMNVLTLRTGVRREQTPGAVSSVAELQAAIEVVQRVHLSAAVRDYIVRVVAATRRLPQVTLGCSPRASVALAQASQARAAFAGRPYVTADDVKALASPVLAHRMLLATQAELEGATTAGVVTSVLSDTAVPDERVPV